MADLFGRPDAAPRPRVEPFYCYGCARTYSKFCKKHQVRHCASGKNRCPNGFCEECDLGLPPRGEGDSNG